MKAHVTMDMGDSYPACQWHADAETGSGAEERLRVYVEQAEDGTPLFQRLEADLRECRDCMYVYHKARERLVQENPDYDRDLFELEARRIGETLRRSTADDSDIMVPVTEVLWHPFLLLSREIEKAFCTRLLELNKAIGLEGFLHERIPTMYLLLIHPNLEIRDLAWQCLQGYGVTENNYEDIQQVLPWIISVQTQKSLRSPSMQARDFIRFPNQVRKLPPHLLCVASHAAYWQGVAHLLSIFNKEALQHGLSVSPCLKRLIPTLIKQISDYTNEQGAGGQSPFWCQLQCLTFLMDKLGSKVWRDVFHTKMENIFEIIKLHPVFMPAIQAMVERSTDDEQGIALLHTPSTSGVSVGPTEPFKWIPPYINSLLGFGQSVIPIIATVVNFLCSQLTDLLDLGYHLDDPNSGSQMRDLSPLDSLIVKLMRTLLKVLQSLLSESLLGQLGGTINTSVWMETCVAFLNRYPPRRAQRGVSVLVELANNSRQFLIDIFKIAQKDKVKISMSTKYIKMVGLPQRPDAASSGLFSASGVPKKLWELKKEDKEFEDCVKFVERTLKEHSLGSPSCGAGISKGLSRMKQDMSNIPSTSSDSSINQVSKNLPRSSLGRLPATPKMCKAGKALETNVLTNSPAATSPEYACKPFEEATRPPAKTTIKVETPRPVKSFQKEESVTPIIPSDTALQALKAESSPRRSFQGSSDEIILISDNLSSDEASAKVPAESQESSDVVVFQGSCMENIYEISSSSSLNGDSQDDTQDTVTEEGRCLQGPKWQPSVVLQVIPELQDVSETNVQFIVGSVDPLRLRRVETRRTCKKKVETTDSESSLTSVDIWGDIHPKPSRKRRRKRPKRLGDVQQFLASSEDEEDIEPQQQGQVRQTLGRSGGEGHTMPMQRSRVREFLASSEDEDSKPSFLQLSTPEKVPPGQSLLNSAWHSSPKYPKNRLSLSRRKQKFKSRPISSSDENNTPSKAADVHMPERCVAHPVQVKAEPLSDCETASFQAEKCKPLPLMVEDKEEADTKEDGERMQSCAEGNTQSSTQLMLSDDQVLTRLNCTPSSIAENCESEEERVSDSEGSQNSESLLKPDASFTRKSLPYLFGDSDDSDVYTSQFPPPEHTTEELLLSLYSTDSEGSGASFQSVVLAPIESHSDDPGSPTASEHQTGNSENLPPDQQEDIKPMFHFVKARKTSAGHSSQGFSDSYSYTEDRCDSDSIIDLDNYNDSELYVEDSLIQISSDGSLDPDDGIDLNASADELEIDLKPVKQEKDVDSDPPSPSYPSRTMQSHLNPSSGLSEDPDCLIALHNEEEPAWFDDDVSDDGQESQDDVGGDASEDEEESEIGDETVMEEEENIDEFELQSHRDSPTSGLRDNDTFLESLRDDENEDLQDQSEAGKEARQDKEGSEDENRMMEERLLEDDEDNMTPDEMEDIHSPSVDDAPSVSAVQDNTDHKWLDKVTWESSTRQEEEARKVEEVISTEMEGPLNKFERMLEAATETKKERKSEERKKRRKKARSHRLTVKEVESACQRSSSHVASTRGPITVTHSTKSNSGLPVAISSPASTLPKVQGSWKPCSFHQPEFTPTDAQPLKRFRGNDKEPVFTDAYVLDSSQPVRKRPAMSAEEERPSATVQSWANRFSSRTEVLCEEMKKGPLSAPRGNESMGREFPKRVRYNSGPPTVRQTVASLAPSTCTSSTSSAMQSYIQSLPHYAKNVYAPPTVAPFSVPSTVQVQSSTTAQDFSHCTSGRDAGVTTDNVDVSAVASQPLQQTESGTESPSPSISQPRFQFFTSDLQTASTASCLPSHINSSLLSNPAATSSDQSSSSRPLQRSISQPEKPETQRLLNSEVREPCRPPTVSIQPQAAVNLPKTVHFSEEDLYYWLIGWNSQWLDIYGRESESQLPTSIPPILAECPFRTLNDVPQSFNSFDEYFKAFVPLLLHEIWAQMQNKSDSSQPNLQAAFVECKYREQKPTGFLLSCTCRVAAADGACPINCQDVVKVSSIEDAAHSWQPLLGVVTSMMPVVPKSASPQNLTNPNPLLNGQVPKEPAEKCFEVSMLILAKNEEIYRAVSSNTGHKVQLKVMHSLVSAVRQFRGLISLPKCGLLASDILRYRRMDVFCPAPSSAISTTNPAELEILLDQYQLQAINVASKAIAEPDTLPRICLIQGAPGTGKTQTIIGLVKKILASQKENQYRRCLPGQQSAAQKPPPILLCAPSHPSVNVLVKRLTAVILTTFLHKTQPAHKEVNKQFHVVRVGRSHLIHESVKRFSLDSQVQEKRNQDATQISLNLDRKKKRRKTIEEAITKLDREGEQYQHTGNSEELFLVQNEQTQLKKDLQMVDVELADLRRKRADLDARPNAYYEQAILDNADIICCTANFSGNELLQGNSGRGGKHRKMKFSCLIVDEANQCSELDSIIPLQNCSMKVVLVGDVQMLPATVISKEAIERGLCRSLFERLSGWFQSAKMNPALIHVLEKQHRMHADVVVFPSKYFYSGQLQSDKIMARKRSSFFLQPYLVFDVIHSREIQLPSRASMNEAEAKMVSALYRRICSEKMKKRIMVDKTMSVGIIVPYKDQASYLSLYQKKTDKDLLKSCPQGFKLPDVEISTMDQFQGREKDVIIVSYVRAQGLSENLQSSADLSSCFTGNRKRMNFVLTRARYSLFIVAHLSTLQKNPDWRALAADADKRKLVVHVQETDIHEAAKLCSKHHGVPPGKTSGDPRPKTTPKETAVGPEQAMQGASDINKNAGGEGAVYKPSASSSTQGLHSTEHVHAHGAPSTPLAATGSVPRPTSAAMSNGSTNTASSQHGFQPLKSRLLSSQAPDETGTPSREPPRKSCVASAGKAKKTSKFPKKKVSFQGAVQQSFIPKPMQGSQRVQAAGKPNPYKVVHKSPEGRTLAKRSPKLPTLRQSLKKTLLMGERSPRKQPQDSPTMVGGNAFRVQPVQSRNKPTDQRGHQEVARGSFSTSSGSQPGRIADPSEALHGSGHSGHRSRTSLLNTTDSSASAHPQLSSKYTNQGHFGGSTSSNTTVPADSRMNSAAKRLPGQPAIKNQSHPGSPDQLRRTVENLKRKFGKEKRTKPLVGLQPDPKLARRRHRSGSGLSAPETETGDPNGHGSPVRSQYFPHSDSDSE